MRARASIGGTPDRGRHRRHARLARRVAGHRLRRDSRPARRRRHVRRARPSARGAVAIVAETPRRRRASPCRGCARRTRGSRSPSWRPSSTAIRATQLTVVGVTGTNGKTTTTYLLASVFDAAGMPCGRIGTVTFRVGPAAGDERDASHTTPEASEVQRLLREMVGPRLPGLRDGGLVARARAAARRRLRFAAAHLHQPDARPSRLSRRHAAVLRRQAAAVRDAAGRRARRRQRRRSARRRARRARCRAS